jgi:hypothetical protein
MSGKAPRLLMHVMPRFVRGAWRAVALVAGVTGAFTPASAQDPEKVRSSGGGCVPADLPPFATAVRAASGAVKAAFYVGPTTAYGHGVLGDAVEATSVLVAYDGPLGGFCDVIDAGDDRVFEDTNPRLVDVTGDGLAEVVVVAAHQRKGARVEIYGYPGPGQDIALLAHTPYIGQRFRWRGVVGVTDLDGDGQFELAEIDRPHLAKTLRIWRIGAGEMAEIAALPGWTNHRIGEVDIAGGIRECGSDPELIVASGNWARLAAIRWTGSAFEVRDLGRDTSRAAFGTAMAC